MKILKKLRANAKWAGLSPAQLNALDTWLFEDRLDYEEVLERAKRELQFTGGLSSLKRYYARRSKERIIETFAESRDQAEVINGAPGSAQAMRSAALKTLAHFFLKEVREAPAGIKEWAPLAGLLLQSEENDIRRQLKTEENQIRRQYLAFAKERFRFDTVEEALKLLPELQKLAEARMTPQESEYAANKWFNDVVRQLFGDSLPEPRKPECEEEEAAYAEAMRKYDEEGRKENEKFWKFRAARKAAQAQERAAEVPPAANTQSEPDSEEQ